MLELGGIFQISLMFVSEARSLPIEWGTIECATSAMLKLYIVDKHSSLLVGIIMAKKDVLKQ